MADKKRIVKQIQLVENDLTKKMNAIEENFGASKNKIWEELNYVKGEIDEVKTNYNEKFEKTNGKIEEVRQTINANHINLMEKLHTIDMKIK